MYQQFLILKRINTFQVVDSMACSIQWFSLMVVISKIWCIGRWLKKLVYKKSIEKIDFNFFKSRFLWSFGKARKTFGWKNKEVDLSLVYFLNLHLSLRSFYEFCRITFQQNTIPPINFFFFMIYLHFFLNTSLDCIIFKIKHESKINYSTSCSSILPKYLMLRMMENLNSIICINVKFYAIPFSKLHNVS